MNIVLAFTNAVGTISSIFFIDSMGRRYLILRTVPFISISWVIVAVGIIVQANPDTYTLGGAISTAGILLFILIFAFGMGSTPWTINSEIYPLHVAGTANSLSAFTNWLCNGFISTVFPIITASDTVAIKCSIYFMLALFAVGCWFFTYYLIPETANKSIE